MKNFLLGTVVTIIVFVIFGFRHENKFEDPNKEWVISPRFLTLQKGITKQQARDWMEKEYLPLYRDLPGYNAMLGEITGSGFRGKADSIPVKKGDFVLIYLFDSKVTHQRYFPSAGSFGDEIKKNYEAHKSTWDDLFDKYFVLDKYTREEYTMFASAK